MDRTLHVNLLCELRSHACAFILLRRQVRHEENNFARLHFYDHRLNNEMWRLVQLLVDPCREHIRLVQSSFYYQPNNQSISCVV